MSSSTASTIVTGSVNPIDRLRTHDEIISPLTYRERTRAFLPKEQEVNVLDHYFIGPADTTHHSKLPFFIRVHGSVMPHMVLPMLFIAFWTTMIWYLVEKQHIMLKFNPQLMTVTGFIVGLALSFRNTTGYDRYNEGRKYWAQLTVTSQTLARLIWVHTKEREGHLSKEDLLAKITCLQLIPAFAIALKHRLRFEPYVEYDDLHDYVGYLDTFAREANKCVDMKPRTPTPWKRFGQFLGLPFAESNPRKTIKRASKPLGNLPLEILSHIQSYLNTIVDNGTLKTPVFSVPVVNAITTLNDILTGTERILSTPLPLAYRIVISQITWLYVLALPFQLHTLLKWKMIPATLITSYIILGLALIGSHVENPFGDDVNDLPLDKFCDDIAHDIDVISSLPAAKSEHWMRRTANRPLWPLSRSSVNVWENRSEEEIREALKMKVGIRFDRSKIKVAKEKEEDAEA